MKVEENDLGNFFNKELKDHTEELTHLEYERISAMISKSGFYYFSFYRFNVYYASAIAAGFFISLLVAGDYMFNSSKQKNSSVVERVVDSSGLKAVTDTITIVAENSNEDTVLIREEHKYNGIANSKQVVTKNESVLLDDTSAIMLPQPDESLGNKTVTKADSVKPERKKIYIVRKDTLHKVDTLPANAKRKLRKLKGSE